MYIYIYIILYHYISIHSHNMFNYIYFGLFRIATSQECLDIWNSSHLDPGGGGCQWPPFIHGFMSSNPWGQTSSGSPKLKQRIWRFRLPSKIFCCSSWPIMLLPVVSCLFQGLFCFSGNPIPEESERAGTWCPRTLASQCHSSTSCFWDWQGVMSRNAGNLMMTDERAKFQLQFLHLLYLDLSLSNAVPVLSVPQHHAHFLACLVCFVRNWGLGWCSEFWTSGSSSWKCCWFGVIDFWETNGCLRVRSWHSEGWNTAVWACCDLVSAVLRDDMASSAPSQRWSSCIASDYVFFCLGVIIKSVWFYTKVTGGDLKIAT